MKKIALMAGAVAMTASAAFAGSSALLLNESTLGPGFGVGHDALVAEGYTITEANDWTTFAGLLTSGDYDLVVVDEPANLLSGGADTAINNYVASGGRVVMSYWNMDVTASMWATFGIAGAVDFFSPMAVNVWDAGSPVWAGIPGGVAIGGGASPWFDNGDTMTVGAGGTALGGFTAAPTAGQAAVVMANDGRTFVNGFDYDSMDQAAVLTLVRNEIAFPAPGALALLGLAGFAGGRRRR
jgi:hypothetical protein